MPARTLYEKLWTAHTVSRLDDRHILLYVDLHVLNEYTSPQAFTGLRDAKRLPWAPQKNRAVVDHVNPTSPTRVKDVADKAAALQITNIARNCSEFGIELVDYLHARQGIEHVVVPELGLARPGMVIACGDSHTTTYGAFGALGFGIGTSEVEHVLATQTLVYAPLKNMRIVLDGGVSPAVTAKDLIMAVIGEIGTDGAAGHAVELSGDAISALSVEGRMTVCNMAVEAGARVCIIAPDAKVFDYLKDKPRTPGGDEWANLVSRWRAELKSDDNAEFDRKIRMNASLVQPQVSWGTSPDQVICIDGVVPNPADEREPSKRAAMVRALEYMGLAPLTPLRDIRIDRAFIGSCTNSRIEDLRDAARLLRGRHVAPHVRAMIVPGSSEVRRQAEEEGLHTVFLEAGFEWRQSGCSMCLAMNDDVLAPGERCASSTNRNFEGRQGRGGRTHLMSPIMVAAAAIAGYLADARDFVSGER